MLPDLRFVIGAALATALLGVTAFGLITSVQITHQTRLSPLEASRRSAHLSDQRELNNLLDDARRVDRPAPTPEPSQAEVLAASEVDSPQDAAREPAPVAKLDLPDATETTASVPDALSPIHEPERPPAATTRAPVEAPPVVTATPKPPDVVQKEPVAPLVADTEPPKPAEPLAIAPARDATPAMTATPSAPVEGPAQRVATVTPAPSATEPGTTASVTIEPATEPPPSPSAPSEQLDAATPVPPVGGPAVKSDAPAKALAAKPPVVKEKTVSAPPRAKLKKPALVRKPVKVRKSVRKARRIIRPRRIIGYRVVQPASVSQPFAAQRTFRPPPPRTRITNPLEELFGR